MADSPKPPTCQDLRTNQPLWYKIHVFLYDLRNFRGVAESQERLDIIIDVSYIGLPCFTQTEAQTLNSKLIDTSASVHQGKAKAALNKNPSSSPRNDDRGQKGADDSIIPGTGHLEMLEMVIEEILSERVEGRIKKREESGEFRVCAAHDLAPILEKALGIDPKALAKDREF